jgi:hypothetical protein
LAKNDVAHHFDDDPAWRSCEWERCACTPGSFFDGPAAPFDLWCVLALQDNAQVDLDVSKLTSQAVKFIVHDEKGMEL